MKPSDKIRLIVFPTIFGVLWGVIEMLLGSYLHMINFPLRGAFLAGAGGVILSIERTYTPVRGATLYTGLIALAMKLLSIGAFKLGPAAGIMIETVVIEAVFSTAGVNALSIFIACALACLEGIPHFFVTNWLMYGSGIFGTYLTLVKQLQKAFGLGPDLWEQILAVWIAAHVLIGATSGFIAIKAAKYLRKI